MTARVQLDQVGYYTLITGMLSGYQIPKIGRSTGLWLINDTGQLVLESDPHKLESDQDKLGPQSTNIPKLLRHTFQTETNHA